MGGLLSAYVMYGFDTAGTLADFCRQNPRATLRFITPREARKGLTTGLVVLMSSQDADPCQKILGQQ